MGIRCADHVTPLYPQKLALTSPTGGGRSVGIVRSWTKATEFIVLSNHSMHIVIRIRNNGTEPRPVGVALFHEDRQTDGNDAANSRYYDNFLNVSKNDW